jgi:GT2 family glycosyltransferase
MPEKRRRENPAKFSLRSDFGRVDHNTFSGFVYGPAELTRKFWVELLVDGIAVATIHADRWVESLAKKRIGDACFGFTFDLPDEVTANAEFIEARLANLDVPLGAPIGCDEIEASATLNQTADLKWTGGLRFQGWLALGSDEAVDISVGQELVMKIQPSGWTHADLNDGTKPARRLDFHLPDRFADGCVRLLSAKTAGGRSVSPHPLAFVAFENGLEEALAGLGKWQSEKLRGKLFDQLVPASLPFSCYRGWKERFPPKLVGTTNLQAAVILVGNGRIEETIESLEAQSHPFWTAVAVPPLDGVTRFDPEAALSFLKSDASDCEFVIFSLAGAVFYESAVQRFAAAFDLQPDCTCCYGDIDILMDDRSVWPLALPAFDRERMLEQGYAAHLFALKRSEALAALAACDNLYRLFNVGFDKKIEPSAVLRLPGALAALPRFDTGRATRELAEATTAHILHNNVHATVREGSPGILPAVRVRRSVANNDRTTIVIPTRNRHTLLRKCIDSIMPAVKKSGASVLIVDNDSSEAETLKYLSDAPSIGVAVVSVGGPFNFSRINNVAARHTDAHNLCLLNNDIEATDDDWLMEMLSRLNDPGVGAVGAKLVWPSGVIQHGGVVLGTNFAATHAFNDRIEGDPGYGDMLRVAHECSAVTAACLLVRRKDYLAVEGMDEIRFPVNFNDVDLCLKLRARGQSIVFTPYARLLHLESASRGRDDAADRKSRFAHELQMLRSKWGQSLLDDPYYNPTLALDVTPFSGLAWPPRSWQPQSNLPPRPSSLPPGF